MLGGLYLWCPGMMITSFLDDVNKKYQKWYTIDKLGAIFAIFKDSHFGHF